MSSNTVLIFEAGATESTGVVTIAAVDNGAEEDDLEVTVSGTLGAGASDVSGPMDLTLTILDDEAPSPACPTYPTCRHRIDPETLACALRAHDGPVCAGWGAAAADRPARGRAARQARRPGLQRHRAAAGPAAQCARRCGGLEPVPVAPRHEPRPADRDRLRAHRRDGRRRVLRPVGPGRTFAPRRPGRSDPARRYGDRGDARDRLLGPALARRPRALAQPGRRQLPQRRREGQARDGR